MLLSDSNVEHLQRRPCPKAAITHETLCSDQSSNHDYVQGVTYQQLLQVVKNVEKQHKCPGAVQELLHASAGKVNNNIFSCRVTSKRPPAVPILRKLFYHGCDNLEH